jgi:hypothetical protein
LTVLQLFASRRARPAWRRTLSLRYGSLTS